jgi:hypothetical protein
MSGAAKRRRRRLRELFATASNKENAVRDGGDLIDNGTLALKALVHLTGAASEHCALQGDEFSALLSLIHEEIAIGRAVQYGDKTTFEREAA